VAGGPPVVCRNCEAPVERAYCPVCGQGATEARAGFHILLRDFFEGYLGYDSALRRTLLPLLFRPGRLTRDYLDGKRKRFYSPLRFYIFCSILLFLFLDLDPVELVTSADLAGPAAESRTGPEPTEGAAEVGAPLSERDSIDFFSDTTWLGRTFNPTLRAQAERLEAMTPETAMLVIAFRARDAIPKVLFLLLPLVALFLKLLLLGTGALYFDHFILTLHAQSFLFLLATALTLLFSASMTALVLAIVLPVYWLLALKRVYPIGWPRAVLTLPVFGLLVATTALLGTLGLIVYAALTA